jgi:hypothetical protein
MVTNSVPCLLQFLQYFGIAIYIITHAEKGCGHLKVCENFDGFTSNLGMRAIVKRDIYRGVAARMSRTTPNKMRS